MLPEWTLGKALRVTFPALQRLGLNLTRKSFYSPIPDTSALTPEVFERRSSMRGVDIDLAAQLALCADWERRFSHEYRRFARRKRPGDTQSFTLDNSSYGAVDAEAWWCMLRSRRPRRVVEVGSGNSTLLALDALALNEREGAKCAYTVVDPYPRVRSALAGRGGFSLLESRVQDVPLHLFEELEDGDILFIDSSHVAALDSDVCFEVLEVLPLLAPGVLVHFHDIMLPLNYPRRWVNYQYFWNEQYLLQAFLAFNHEFETILSGRLLALEEPERLAQAFPSFRPDATVPGCFWIRRVAEGAT